MKSLKVLENCFQIGKMFLVLIFLQYLGLRSEILLLIIPLTFIFLFDKYRALITGISNFVFSPLLIFIPIKLALQLKHNYPYVVGGYLAFIFFIGVVRFSQRYSLLKIVSIGIYLLPFLYLYFSNDLIVYNVFLGTLAISFWYFLYAISFKNKKENILNYFLDLPCFWMPILIPIQGKMSRYFEKKQENIESARESAYRYFLRGILPFGVLALVIESITENNLVFFSVLNSKFGRVSNSQPLGVIEQYMSTGEVYLSAIFGILYFALKFYVLFGAGVVIARLCGIRLYRASYRLFESKSFHEFFYRFNYYYAQTLMDLIIIPLSTYFKKKKLNGYFFDFLSMFIGVSLFGYAHHCLGGFDVWGVSPAKFFQQELDSHYYLYMMILGVLLYLSIQISTLYKLKKLDKFVLITFFVIFSLANIIYRNPHNNSYEGKMIIIQKLIGK